MKVKFNIEYRTHWGENLFLNYSAEGQPAVQVPMTTTDGVVWSAEPELPDATISYYYHVEENGRQTRREYPFGSPRFIHCFALIVIFGNISKIGEAFGMIFRYAFAPAPAIGVFAGSTI